MTNPGGGKIEVALCRAALLLILGGIVMKKFLRISICVFITLSMFCGCKADGALDDEKLSDLVNSENGSNEEKTGINCLSVYNSPSGNGIQLMFSNLPDVMARILCINRKMMNIGRQQLGLI